MKENDFLKDGKKKGKQIDRSTVPTYEVEQYALKVQQNKGMNSESKRMVVERIKEVDR